MTSWAEFAAEAPELAAFGAERLGQGVAFLGTVRADGWPRVHPVTPIVGEGRLFLFMEPTSPKGRDLRRNGRYTMHSLVSDQAGSGGEFLVRGRATPVNDPAVRAIAVGAAIGTPGVWLLVADYAWESGMTDGLALLTLATGVALAWTGVTGRQPDWIDQS